MRKLIRIAVAESVTIAAGVSVNVFTDIAPAWIWPAVVIVGLLYLVGDWVWSRRKQKGDPSSEKSGRAFDLPLHRAIDHVIQTSKHSYNSQSGAERMAFQALHEEMCNGRLPVVGSWGEGTAPQRISRRKCRRFMPVATVVPLNPTAPEGIRFDLVDKAILDEPPQERPEPIGFTALRLRSADFYRLWPPLAKEAQ